MRLLQNTTGFEEGTGLPIPGNLPATALVILLVLLAAVLILLVRRLPQKAAPAFPADFTARDPRLLFVPMAGLFLMGISGVLDLVAGSGPDRNAHPECCLGSRSLRHDLRGGHLLF